MLVKFKMDVTWTDRSCSKGEVIELGDALCQNFLQRGFVEEVKKSKEVMFEPIIESDKDIVTSKDSGGGKPAHNSGGKDARSRGADRRHK